ncbi:preprotein translocase subunit SecG [Aquirufa sp. OSTEICH-129V]|jgi:preprotein translocase subunit SecG|uniref:Protein-export membrane protein SecG n=1 Tax=Aquirufa avitistagni TaxID=3104728 RepID=A0ABW6DDI8_9BACT
MFTLLISLIVLFSALLIILILVQNPKGGGISGEFSSSGATQMFGVQKTGDLVEQLTWGFSIAILVLVLVTNFTLSSGNTEGIQSINVEKASTKTLPTAPAPAPATK